MPTHVYANNNEVASKAADGKSIAAFPDVCFSPPAPPVGPMPLPYPNTGEVKDTDSGTAKVFIKDKMSGMGDDSHMTKSMGDEAATQNFNKGMITGALQGKCYFGLWSMDVNMEGKGVPRNIDTLNHNTSSVPTNINGIYFSDSNICSTRPPYSIYTGEVKFRVYFVDKTGFQYKKIIGLSITEIDGAEESCTVYSAKTGCFELTTKAKGLAVKFDFYHDGRSEHGVTKPVILNSIKKTITPMNRNITIHRSLSVSADSNIINVECLIDIGNPLVIFIGGAGDLWSECLFKTAKDYYLLNKDVKDVMYYTYNGMFKDFSTSNEDIVSDIMIQFIMNSIRNRFLRRSAFETILKWDAAKINYTAIVQTIERTYKCNTFKTITIIAHSWGGSAYIQKINPALVDRDIIIHNVITLDPVGNSFYYDAISAMKFIVNNYEKIINGIDTPNIERAYEYDKLCASTPFLQRKIIKAISTRVTSLHEKWKDNFYEILIVCAFFANDKTIVHDYLKNTCNLTTGANTKGDADIDIFKKNLEIIRPKSVSSCEPKAQPQNIIKFFNVYIDYKNKSLLDINATMPTNVALLGCPWETISNLTNGENILCSGCTHEKTDTMLNCVLPKIKF